MIALPLLLALQAAAPPVDGGGLGVLPPQQLPGKGCAAYLWSTDAHRLVAMASADPPRLRVVLDGNTIDLPRAESDDGSAYGLPATTHYRLDGISVTLDLTIQPRPDLAQGAMVPQATLSLDRPGRDGLVLAAGGLIGCAT